MDILCPRCGEPWEIDTLHEEVSYRHPDKPWYLEDEPVNDRDKFFHKDMGESGLWYSSVIYATYYNPIRKEFLRNGCVALTAYNTRVCEPRPGGDIRSAIYDILGDDLDAAAVEFEDAERMGLL